MSALEFAGLTLFETSCCLQAAEYPQATTGDYRFREFRLASGETLPEVRIHYRTFGQPRRTT